MVGLEALIDAGPRPALLIGNGINRFDNDVKSGWEQLLAKLASQHGLEFTPAQTAEMSNTEFFDILDLARPKEDRRNLQSEFCEVMKSWTPSAHHADIVGWARRHDAPIITVNFDENLSKSIEMQFFRSDRGFTDYYPWNTYFSDRPIVDPRSSFAIWHAHGMMRYARSIRLGLMHYMGSVQRARHWVFNREGLRSQLRRGNSTWDGSDTWLEVLFFSPLAIIGFNFAKDETFLRWLFLERAVLHKLWPHLKSKTWFITVDSPASENRRPFFERLGMEYLIVDNYDAIYRSELWQN